MRLMVYTSDDDDDEEPSGDPEAAVPEGEDTSAEPGVNPPAKHRSEHAATQELYIYSAAELATFKKRELVADTEFLDGIA